MTNSSLAVVILAAGRSTRMKSDLPKVLHHIAGQPLLDYVLGAAVELAATDVTLVATPPYRDEFASRYPKTAVAVQTDARGTAHAVLAARDRLIANKGPVLILYGDNPLIRPETLKRMLAEVEAGAALSVAGFRPMDTAGYGRLLLDDDGNLSRIVEEREANAEEQSVRLCNAGFMAVRGDLLVPLLDRVDDNNSKGEFYLTDLVALACGDGHVCRAVECAAEEAIGVDSRTGLAAAEQAMQQRLRQRAMDAGVTLIDPATTWFSHDTALDRDVLVEPSVFFGPGVRVGRQATIKAFSHLEGCNIATGAVIGPFARIRPGSDIAADVRIGNFVEVKNASVEAGAKANHLSYLGDARIGAGANIGAGTITCNYDGYLKSHTDIGVNAFIGSNSALVAPVKIGDGALVGAGSTIAHDVAADSIVVERAAVEERPGMAKRYRERKLKLKAERGND